MKISNSIALAAMALALGAGPSFAQGVSQTPPAPNSSQSSPQPVDSLPEGARTLAPGSTGEERMGTVGTTTVNPGTAPASNDNGSPS